MYLKALWFRTKSDLERNLKTIKITILIVKRIPYLIVTKSKNKTKMLTTICKSAQEIKFNMLETFLKELITKIPWANREFKASDKKATIIVYLVPGNEKMH